MLSYWEKEYWFPNYDYCIVGAGIVGLTTALFLKEKNPDKKIVILDRSSLPLGASTKNAGFACYGTVGEILDDLKDITEEEVISTISLRWRGLQLLQELHSSESITYKQVGGTELFRKKADFEKCADHLSYANELLLEATGKKESIYASEQTFSSALYNRTLYNPLEGSLNPVRLITLLIAKLKKVGVDILLGMALEEYSIHQSEILAKVGPDLSLQTKNLIFATNAFTSTFFPEMDIVPARNQVLVSDPIPALKLLGTFHLDRGYTYFRNISNRLLIGGARNLDHENETTELFGPNELIQTYLRDFVTTDLGFMNTSFSHSWSGIIATGKSKNPVIRQVDNHIYVAARLGGMGVATGSAVAEKLVQLVLKN